MPARSLGGNPCPKPDPNDRTDLPCDDEILIISVGPSDPPTSVRQTSIGPTSIGPSIPPTSIATAVFFSVPISALDATFITPFEVSSISTSSHGAPDPTSSSTPLITKGTSVSDFSSSSTPVSTALMISFTILSITPSPSNSSLLPPPEPQSAHQLSQGTVAGIAVATSDPVPYVYTTTTITPPPHTRPLSTSKNALIASHYHDAPPPLPAPNQVLDIVSTSASASNPSPTTSNPTHVPTEHSIPPAYSDIVEGAKRGDADGDAEARRAGGSDEKRGRFVTMT
ncbi:hypothetical protein BJ165DRAFT_1531832 [Panaeolus papilionaceus]|nr:hypothetical protein BJ165DRAFT_1531832 [Panaeolus papilionaceus]